MCDTVTLQTAVLNQVNEFVQQGKVFSVYEITQAIRKKTAQGELEIPEVEVNGASFRFDIPHVKVKALFDESWRTGIFNSGLSRKYNGQYWEYSPSPVTASPTVNVQASVPLMSTVAPLQPVVSKIPVTTFSKQVIQDRIKTYLLHCAASSYRPTIKQVQSAIKRGDMSTGWSCQEIQDLIVNDIGATVNYHPDYVSLSQVVTC
jgi:hypothetical protein